MSVSSWLVEGAGAVAVAGQDDRRRGDAADHLAELRAMLGAAALDAVTRGAGPDAGPLRLSKSRLSDMEQCERTALARWRGDHDLTMSDTLLKGIALDRFVAHQLTGAFVRDPARDLAAILAAEAEWDALYHLESMDESAAVEMLGPLAAAVADSWSDLPPSWWARSQERSMLVLADGAVVVSGVIDVGLGGAPTAHPSVLVEVKSGRPVSSHPSEVYLYALLVALRDDTAPAVVARWYPGADPVGLEVTDGVLESAARRLAVGMATWAELQHGRPPVETPGPWCMWCPDAPRCPSAATAENGVRAQNGPVGQDESAASGGYDQ